MTERLGTILDWLTESLRRIDWSGALESGAIIVASLTAIYGINAWRRELRERRRMELAEEALTAIYEIKDAISSIRNIMGWAGEHDADSGARRPRHLEQL